MKDQVGINKDLLKRVEKLVKEKVEKKEELAADIAEVIVVVKGSVAVDIWETKIKLVDDMANAGSKNVVG